MKLALIFPGIGYHCDKPLLYYSQKLLSKEYKIIQINYGTISKAKADLQQTFELAYQRVLEEYSSFDFSAYESIVCISKSVGTAIATRVDEALGLEAEHVLYTPIAYTFDYAKKGIAFTGTNDPWVDTQLVIDKCKELQIPLEVYEGCNHSLECQNVLRDIETLEKVMQHTLKFLETL